MEKFSAVAIDLFSRLSVIDSLLLFLLILSWLLFYYIIKILWKAYNTSQENRIAENKNMIKVQESTTTAINALTKMVEVGFSAMISKKDK